MSNNTEEALIRMIAIASRPDKRVGRIRSGVFSLIITYQRSAELRGLVWDLTHEEANTLMSGNCHYCGSAPSRRKSVTCKVNGIDRMDNSQGYRISNCVPCCTNCNRMKMVLGYDEFLNHVARIYEYRKTLTKSE